MATLIRGLALLCVATCITQVLLLAFYAARGTLNPTTGTKVIALVNGIDITGERLRRILRESDDGEQPSFEQVLEARRLAGLDMDLRLRSQNRYRGELAEMLAKLINERDRFDDRRDAFERNLNELEQGAIDEGITRVQRLMQELEADKAKDMLLRWFDDERIDDVVKIVQAIPSDKRKDILAEFESDEENDMLYQIIRRIGDGLPVTSLIEQARAGGAG